MLSSDLVSYGVSDEDWTTPPLFFRLITGAVLPLVGENTEREKSIMYLTVFEQNRHGVSRTSGFSSVVTFSGKDRRHSVQVITIYGIPFESFPLRGIQTGAEPL